MVVKEKIIEVLQLCYDPEIPIDLWNLGLIYSIDINDNETGTKNVHITMSLTTPGCSMGQHMASDIKTKVSSLEGVNNVDVDVTFDPPWNPEMISEAGKLQLGMED
mgnify:CR=1 FL=1